MERSLDAGETSKSSATCEIPRIEILFDAAAEKDFDKIGRGKHQAQVRRKIDELESNPKPADARPIKGESYRKNGWNFFRVDVGEYRIVYDLDESSQTLTIVTIGVIAAMNDDKVYRLMDRRFG